VASGSDEQDGAGCGMWQTGECVQDARRSIQVRSGALVVSRLTGRRVASGSDEQTTVRVWGCADGDRASMVMDADVYDAKIKNSVTMATKIVAKWQFDSFFPSLISLSNDTTNSSQQLPTPLNTTTPLSTTTPLQHYQLSPSTKSSMSIAEWGYRRP